IYAWMDGQEGFFNYSGFSKEFPGVQPIVFAMSVAERGEFVSFYRRGYISLANLGIGEEEKEMLKGLLKETVSACKTNSLSNRDIYAHFLEKRKEWLNQKDIRFPFDLFSLLRNLFRKEYRFHHSYIEIEEK
ncbi:MAG: hypothetical protein J5736_04185, partial [Bacilli bacterium]|nr:hypothetical protein [Bacilli bacterium]